MSGRLCACPAAPAPSAAPRGRFCRENADLADALVGLAAGCERHGFAWQVAPRLRARLARLALGHTAAAIPGDVDAAWLASRADVRPRDSAAAGAAAVLLLAAARSCLSQGGASLALLRALDAVCKDGLSEGAPDPDPKPDLNLDAAPGGAAAQPAAPAAATAAAGSTAGAAAASQSAAQQSCREGAAGAAQGPLAPPPPPPPKLREAVDRLGLGVGELEVLAACVGVDRKTLGLGSAAQQRAALSALLQVRCVKTAFGFSNRQTVRPQLVPWPTSWYLQLDRVQSLCKHMRAGAPGCGSACAARAASARGLGYGVTRCVRAK